MLKPPSSFDPPRRTKPPPPQSGHSASPPFGGDRRSRSTSGVSLSLFSSMSALPLEPVPQRRFRSKTCGVLALAALGGPVALVVVEERRPVLDLGECLPEVPVEPPGEAQARAKPRPPL